jgi:hypothetical protein
MAEFLHEYETEIRSALTQAASGGVGEYMVIYREKGTGDLVNIEKYKCSEEAKSDADTYNYGYTYEIIKILPAAPTAPVADKDDDFQPEWFYRWAARAKAGQVTPEQAISIIFDSPANPYAENNPWVKTPPERDTK